MRCEEAYFLQDGHLKESTGDRRLRRHQIYPEELEQIHFTIGTNTFYYWDKYILQFGQIHLGRLWEFSWRPTGSPGRQIFQAEEFEPFCGRPPFPLFRETQMCFKVTTRSQLCTLLASEHQLTAFGIGGKNFKVMLALCL